MATTCTALNLSDESKCQSEAASSDGLFCRFHAHQCYGLYRGYKRRNARLDARDASPPSYLAASKTTLRNESFSSISDESTLNELYSYLFKKHALLERVIRARKLHHSRFYSLILDYGHKAYLDKLTNDKFTVLRALERLQRRTAEVLYAQRKWFKWVRARQDEEEAARVKEVEMVKKEAKLFKRQWKEVEARLKERRLAEDAERQEAFLEDLYQERMKQRIEDQEEDDEAWDPIEDAVEDERFQFVDMMRHLLWLGGAQERNADLPETMDGTSLATPKSAPKTAVSEKENVDPNKSLIKNARKRGKAKAKALDILKPESAGSAESENDEVKVGVNESREEMRKRLREGVRYNPGEGISGHVWVGTIENPHTTFGNVPGMPREEVEKILDDVAQIKLYLFCRLLLSQAAVLPVAMKAENIADFLADADVSTADLRNLCLRFEQPTLQEIRDACADFFRGDAEDEDDRDLEEETERDEDDPDTKGLMKFKHKHVPAKWRSKHEEEVDTQKNILRAVADEAGPAVVDFGEIEGDEFKKKRVRVKVCGKTIWNYPSDKSLARSGWLHYSIIAKGSSLSDAIELCRNWDEFWQLSVLAIFRYFPSPRWEQWAGNRFRQQLVQLGFIPYLQFDEAAKNTVRHRIGGRTAVVQFKNVIAAHIKRNDPVSRRLVQYLSMQAGSVVLPVRDARTGRLVVEPPEEHCWLVRITSNLRPLGDGTEWKVLRSVGEDMFEQVSGKKMRDWQFGFTDYYDIIVWDLIAGTPWASLYSTVQHALIKAHRMCEGVDMYAPMAPIIKTLWQDKENGRTRDARRGEETIYDVLCHEKSKVVIVPVPSASSSGRVRTEIDSLKSTPPPNWFYSDIDAAEDTVLFPEEILGKSDTTIGDRRADPITKRLERSGPNWKRFIYDLDSDQESDDLEDDELTKKIKEEGRLGGRQKKITNGHNDAPSSSSHSRMSSAGQEQVDEDDGCTCAKCKAGEYDDCENRIDESDDEDNYIYDTDDGDPETMQIAMAMKRIEPDEERDPETDFYAYMDREKAKIFKKQWHQAVLDPEERAQWQKLMNLLQVLTPTSPNAMDKQDRNFCLRTLIWLQTHFHEHRLVWKDMTRTFAAMSIFFPTRSSRRDLSSDLAAVKVLLTDDANRAQTMCPYSRPFQSNLTVSSDHWVDVDAVYRRCKREHIDYYRDWDSLIRPMVAHWFKAGVVGPADLPTPAGEAIVRAHHDGQPQVYFDYRRSREEWPTRSNFSHITNPYEIDLLHLARKWQRERGPAARFALLRMWSHSHFYPLMIGHNNRVMDSFEDAVQRSWEWRFVPKDKAGSEWSMQKSVEILVDPYKKQFKKQVVMKRDIVLVLGTDQDDLRKPVLAAVFALQTRPWRMEVDFWKSFVNIDLAFLEGLDQKWLE